jgi:hypothetical protein
VIGNGIAGNAKLMSTADYLKSKNENLFKRTAQISSRFEKLKSDALKRRSEFVESEKIFLNELTDRQDDLDDMCDDLMRSLKKAEIVETSKLKSVEASSDSLEKAKATFLAKLNGAHPNHGLRKTMALLENSKNRKYNQQRSKEHMLSQNALIAITTDLNNSLQALNRTKADYRKLDFTGIGKNPDSDLTKYKYGLKTDKDKILGPQIMDAYYETFQIPTPAEIFDPNDPEIHQKTKNDLQAGREIFAQLQEGQLPPSKGHSNMNEYIACSVLNEAGYIMNNLEKKRTQMDVKKMAGLLEKFGPKGDHQIIKEEDYWSPNPSEPLQLPLGEKILSLQAKNHYSHGIDPQILEDYNRDNREFTTMDQKQKTEIANLWRNIEDGKKVLTDTTIKAFYDEAGPDVDLYQNYAANNKVGQIAFMTMDELLPANNQKSNIAPPTGRNISSSQDKTDESQPRPSGAQFGAGDLRRSGPANKFSNVSNVMESGK